MKNRNEEYYHLLLRRDSLRKEAGLYLNDYVRIFGDLLSESFKLKINIIEKKKIIAYCQKHINKNEPIYKGELENYIGSVMSGYREELERMLEDVNASKKTKIISEMDVREIKTIYYRIARLIHPDMHPEFQDEKIREFWNQTVEYYQCNRLEKLKEIEFMIHEYLKESGIEIQDEEIDGLDEKIELIENEIERILSTDPYQYRYLLDDEMEIEEKKKEIKEEIGIYHQYCIELDEIISHFEKVDYEA